MDASSEGGSETRRPREYCLSLPSPLETFWQGHYSHSATGQRCIHCPTGTCREGPYRLTVRWWSSEAPRWRRALRGKDPRQPHSIRGESLPLWQRAGCQFCPILDAAGSPVEVCRGFWTAAKACVTMRPARPVSLQWSPIVRGLTEGFSATRIGLSAAWSRSQGKTRPPRCPAHRKSS